VIDTSGVPVGEVAARLIEWIYEERALLRVGAHPLAAANAFSPRGNQPLRD
jgi:hypothetical protein